jgi:hypothetical protein
VYGDGGRGRGTPAKKKLVPTRRLMNFPVIGSPTQPRAPHLQHTAASAHVSHGKELFTLQTELLDPGGD